MEPVGAIAVEGLFPNDFIAVGTDPIGFGLDPVDRPDRDRIGLVDLLGEFLVNLREHPHLDWLVAARVEPVGIFLIRESRMNRIEMGLGGRDLPRPAKIVPAGIREGPAHILEGVIGINVKMIALRGQSDPYLMTPSDATLFDRLASLGLHLAEAARGGLIGADPA